MAAQIAVENGDVIAKATKNGVRAAARRSRGYSRTSDAVSARGFFLDQPPFQIARTDPQLPQPRRQRPRVDAEQIGRATAAP